MRKTICTLLAFVFLVAAMGAGFWFTRQFIECKEEQGKFQQLAESTMLEIIPPKASEPDSQDPEPDSPLSPGADPEAPLPTLEPVHDIAALQSLNPNCLGWITVPGTPIDYPVMWTPADPEFYLRTAFDGEYSSYGVPFMDARCSLDSDNLILYSHNKFDGSMFTALIHYGDLGYFEGHRTVLFETLDGVRQYKIFAVCRANAYRSQIYQSIDFDNKADFLDAVQADSQYNVGPGGSAAEFITLSTCDISRQDGRWVVVGERIG